MSRVKKPIKPIKRKKKVRTEDLNVKIKDSLIEDLAKNLAKQINKEIFKQKYAPIKDILKLVGAGVFLAASVAIPNLPLALRPFLANTQDYEAWKRFNIPYLKRTLKRLQKQKLVEIKEEEGIQVVKITEAGKRRILKYALEKLEIIKPKFWDGKWRLVSYDIPNGFKILRNLFRNYLESWGFYPLHESVLLHAYPCEKQVDFLREYLGVGKFVRIFIATKIENDKPLREFFGL